LKEDIKEDSKSEKNKKIIFDFLDDLNFKNKEMRLL